MLNRCFAIVLPLVAATTIAQERQIVAQGDNWNATTYALDVQGEGAMTIKLTADGDKDGHIRIFATGGQPGSSLNLLMGVREARIPLQAINVKGLLLVDTVFVNSAASFNDKGEFEMFAPLPTEKSDFTGNVVYMQILSVEKQDGGPEVRASNGLKLDFSDAARPEPKSATSSDSDNDHGDESDAQKQDSDAGDESDAEKRTDADAHQDESDRTDAAR